MSSSSNYANLEPNDSLEVQSENEFLIEKENVKMEYDSDSQSTYENEINDNVEIEIHDVKEVLQTSSNYTEIETQTILQKHIKKLDNTLNNLMSETSSSSKITENNTGQESASATIMKYILQNRNSHETQKEDYDIDLFFKSISASLKKLSPYNRAMAKLNILSAITELEVQELKNAAKA